MSQGKEQPANLDAQTVKTLLDKLESDETFRAQFEASPADALRTIGYEGATGCLSLKGPLASAQEIKTRRAKLEQTMVGIQRQDCSLSAQQGH